METHDGVVCVSASWCEYEDFEHSLNEQKKTTKPNSRLHGAIPGWLRLVAWLDTRKLRSSITPREISDTYGERHAHLYMHKVRRRSAVTRLSVYYFSRRLIAGAHIRADTCDDDDELHAARTGAWTWSWHGPVETSQRKATERGAGKLI